MFLLRSQPKPPGPALNAIPAPDRAARRARHLDICEELAELGMDIARAAHREALRDMQPPPAPRALIPGLAYDSPPSAPPRDAIFGQLFALISRAVRQTMLLEDRLANGTLNHTPPEPAPRPTQPQPDSSTPLPGVARPHAERLYCETLEDECLHQDSRPVEHILAGIRTELGAAASAGPALCRETPGLARPRRPIPVIPPGPEPSLTAYERSVLLYHQTHPPKPPD